MKNFKTTPLITFTFFFITTFSFAQGILQKVDFTSNKLKSLVVDVSGADITIKTWSKNSTAVAFTAAGNSNSFIENFNDHYFSEISISKDSSTVTVYLKSLRKWDFFTFNPKKLEYSITVPETFSVDVKTSGGDISIYKLLGSVQGKTSGGDIKLEHIKGIVSVTTSGGEFSFSNISGKLDATTSGGDIKAEYCNGSIDLTTSGGDIVMDNLNGSIYAKTSGGDIKLKTNSDVNEINLSTSGGDIDIKIPKTNLSLDLSTSGGEVNLSSRVKSDFDGRIKSSKVNGDIRKGGKLLKAKTSAGDISLDYN